MTVTLNCALIDITYVTNAYHYSDPHIIYRNFCCCLISGFQTKQRYLAPGDGWKEGGGGADLTSSGLLESV